MVSGDNIPTTPIRYVFLLGWCKLVGIGCSTVHHLPKMKGAVEHSPAPPLHLSRPLLLCYPIYADVRDLRWRHNIPTFLRSNISTFHRPS